MAEKSKGPVRRALPSVADIARERLRGRRTQAELEAQAVASIEAAKAKTMAKRLTNDERLSLLRAAIAREQEPRSTSGGPATAEAELDQSGLPRLVSRRAPTETRAPSR